MSGSIENTTSENQHVSVKLKLVPPTGTALTVPFRIVLGPRETVERSFSFVVSRHQPTGRYRLTIVATNAGKTSRVSAQLVIF